MILVKLMMISVKVAGVIGVLVERDEGVSRMGGEATRSLAMTAMRAATDNYFSRYDTKSSK